MKVILIHHKFYLNNIYIYIIFFFKVSIPKIGQSKKRGRQLAF